MEEELLRIGRINVLYRWFKHGVPARPNNLYRKPANFFPLEQMLVMWIRQDKAESI